MVTRSIGVASRKCPRKSKKTGKIIRTKAERKRCMQRIMKGGKSGVKRKSRRGRRR